MDLNLVLYIIINPIVKIIKKKFVKVKEINVLNLIHNLKFLMIFLKVKNYAHQKDQKKIILIMLPHQIVQMK